jgi:hypothetical protein
MPVRRPLLRIAKKCSIESVFVASIYANYI